MSSRLRISLLAVTAVAAVPLLSACDTSPGAAAIVGSDKVTTSVLQSEVNKSLADPAVQAAIANPQYSATLGADRPSFTRQTLTRLIGQDIVNKVAAAHDVTVSQAEVTAQTNSFVQQAGGITQLQQSAAQQVGVGAKELPSLIRFTVLQQKLGTALTADLPATQAQLQQEYQKDIDTYDQLDIAQIAVTKQSLAKQLLKQVRRNPASFPALARANSIDPTSKAKGGEVGLVGRSQVVGLLGGASKATPGTFQLAHSNSQWIVLHIVKRQVTPLADVVPQLKAALFASQSNQLLSKAITTEATKLGVHVNPRYGSWSNTTQAVIALKSTISSSG